MLVLTRRLGEKVCIGTDIFITFLGIKGSRIRLGIEAPEQVPVVRAELSRALDSENRPPVPATSHNERV